MRKNTKGYIDSKVYQINIATFYKIMNMEDEPEVKILIG